MIKRLFLFMLMIPVFLSAQDNTRYQAGAISLEDGKVVFTKEVTVPGLTQDQLYDKLLAWAEQRFTEKSRVAYADKGKGDIAVIGVERLVFSSTALSLDTSEMTYRLIIQCDGNVCNIQMTNMHYSYNVSYKREPERYTAEEVITDEYALTKKNQLNRLYGKFRKATIDFSDTIFKEIDSLLGNMLLGNTPQQGVETASEPVQTGPVVIKMQEAPVVSTPVVKSEREGYIAFDVDKVPQAIMLMLPESSMRITPGKEQTPVETSGEWKGISTMFGKTVATITLNQESAVYKQIENVFILSFVKAGDTLPWMIIECNKQGETTEGTDKTILGEILQIWIK